MSLKLLYGFHAVGARLRVAPQSVRELLVDPTRHDARMRQLLHRAQESGVQAQPVDAARLDALHNVSLALDIAGGPGSPQREAREMQARVGLGGREHRKPGVLSGGEQQRVALARAFVTRPGLLLADEPTGNLDAATGARVIELLFELQRQQGSTLVLVTHDAQLAARCDAVLELQAGRVLQRGDAGAAAAQPAEPTESTLS